MGADLSSFAAVDLIRRKRDGARLDPEAIDWLIRGYTNGQVAAEQMAAMAMAIYFNGLDRDELSRWTAAMISSGKRMTFHNIGRPSVDKHSTGGVGDKITLVLTPLLAACGAAVPQLSGRGLGHTGGTLDKLEAIPGWKADLSADALTDQLHDIGAVICAAGSDLAPADKLLYALRDVTGTVESIPMIAASIMSKKIAEGTQSLVLDVKVGRGAFMKDIDQARLLANTMIELGQDAGLSTAALLTDMDTPLGRNAGNAGEVAEAVEVLAGGGPSDVVDLTLALAEVALAQAGLEADPAAALAHGQAMDVWRAMIRAQGGNPDATLPRARHSETVLAPRGGFLVRLDALAVGHAAWQLGAGRSRPGDAVQAAAGVHWHASIGDQVRPGDPLFTVHTDDAQRIERAVTTLSEAAEFDHLPCSRRPVVVEALS